MNYILNDPIIQARILIQYDLIRNEPSDKIHSLFFTREKLVQPK